MPQEAGVAPGTGSSAGVEVVPSTGEGALGDSDVPDAVVALGAEGTPDAGDASGRVGAQDGGGPSSDLSLTARALALVMSVMIAVETADVMNVATETGIIKQASLIATLR